MKGQSTSTSGGGAGIPSWLGMASHYTPQSPVFANPGGAAPMPPTMGTGFMPPPSPGAPAGMAGGGAPPGLGAGLSTPMGGAPGAAGGVSMPGVMQNNTIGAPTGAMPPAGAPMMPPTGAMPAQGGFAGNPALHNMLSQLPPGLLGALGGGGAAGGMPPWLSGLLGHGAGGMAPGMAGGMAGGNMAPAPGMSAPMAMSNFARPY